MNMKKAIALMMSLIMCVISFTACSSNNSSGRINNGNNDSDTIKIGFLGPLTGDVAQYGVAVYNGVKMYIDEINEAGGVLGKQIDFIYYDEKGDSIEALNAYNKLVYEDNVVAIIGDVTSKPSIAVAEVANADKIPIISASATADEFTSFGNYAFRSCFLDPYQGETMAKYAAEVLNAKKAAIIWDLGSDYSVGLTNAFIETCKELNVEIVAQENYSKGDVDFKAQLTNIKGTSPDVIFCPDYYNTVVMIAQQAREIGITSSLLGCDGWDGVLAVATDASVLENCFFSNHYSTEDTDPLIQNFLKNFKQLYNEDPMSFSATGYDAAMILFDAIEKAGSTEADAIVAALEATDMDCVTGHITFDENNNPIKSCAIITVKDGKYALDRKY